MVNNIKYMHVLKLLLASFLAISLVACVNPEYSKTSSKDQYQQEKDLSYNQKIGIANSTIPYYKNYYSNPAYGVNLEVFHKKLEVEVNFTDEKQVEKQKRVVIPLAGHNFVKAIFKDINNDNQPELLVRLTRKVKASYGDFQEDELLIFYFKDSSIEVNRQQLTEVQDLYHNSSYDNYAPSRYSSPRSSSDLSDIVDPLLLFSLFWLWQ